MKESLPDIWLPEIIKIVKRGGTMPEYCCDSFKQAKAFGLIEKINSKITEYAFKNNFCYVFIKFCPFCGKELGE